jgi:DNA integrity scanning protein DisA with diadenylate cyclase activity
LDKSRVLLETAKRLSERFEATLVVLVTDRPDVVRATLEAMRLPIILASGNEEMLETHAPKMRHALRLAQPISGSVNVLPQVKEVLLGAFFAGELTARDSVIVMVAAGDAVDMVMHYDVQRDVEIVHLQEELEDGVDLRVVERVLKLAVELAREGREGKPVGTLFVIGDTDTVMRHSRPAVLNPFEGHPEKDRNILDEALWETAKEFAQIDGAFVVRGDGVVVAAGRYVDTEGALEVQSGLGGRHIAAASATRASKALAIVVSSSGTIRVFKGGRVIMVVGRQ